MSLISHFQCVRPEAGVDEAGRGAFAGPVFAAAVILPDQFFHPLLNDSKKVKPADRTKLRDVIEKESIAYAVASVSAIDIDKMNILKATFQAMHAALAKLSIMPGFIIVDGNRFLPWNDTPFECIIQGDGKYASIAAASILAKTYRDDYMAGLHKEYSLYGWDQNKGYGTSSHREAIALHGLCPHHRKSFNIAPIQMKMSF
jgi:ribonuclease HII